MNLLKENYHNKFIKLLININNIIINLYFNLEIIIK